MDEHEPSVEEIMDRLLRVMPAGWLVRLAENLARLYDETGHGEVEIVVYRGRIVQLNRVVKER